MRRTLPIISLLAITSWHGLARAEDPAPTAATPAPAPQAGRALGIGVVLASIAAGAAVTIYGLSIDCSEQDHACHRRASLPIFGGVGLAAAGSIVGLTLMPSPDGTSSAALTIRGRFD